MFCDNQILTDDVVIEMKESGAMKVLKDDVETDAPKGAFTVAGKYEVTLTDSLGNEIVYRFTLLDKSVKEFEYRLPNDIKVKVKEDPSAVKDGVITITQTGNYTLEFSKDGYTWTSLLEVRNSPPEIDVVQDGNYYVLKNTTPYNLTVSLVRNGKTYNYSFGDTLTGERQLRSHYNGRIWQRQRIPIQYQLRERLGYCGYNYCGGRRCRVSNCYYGNAPT